jgi:hypothetical protein
MPGTGILYSAHSAENGKKNIAIGRLEGPKSSKIRLALMRQLKESDSFSVTDAEDLKSTAGRSSIAKMAAALQVDAVVLGTISNNSNLTLSIYKSDGRLVEQVKVKGGSSKKLEAAIENDFDASIAPALVHASGAKPPGRAAAAAAGAAVEEEAEPEVHDTKPPPEEPPPAEPSKAETPPEDEPEAGEATSEAEAKKGKKKGAESKHGRTPLEATAGMRGYSRHFKYTDVLGVRDPSKPRTLEPYNLPFAPSVLLTGVLYPGAFFDDGVLGNIGLMARGEIGFATSTDYQLVHSDGSTSNYTLKTTYQAWDVGLRGRIPIGPVEIALFAEYGMQTFILHGDEGGTGLPPLVPDVRYTFVRLGAEPSLRLGKFSVSAMIAPRILTSLKNIDLPYVWFPNAKGRGLDFGMTVGYGVASFLDVVAGADYVAYGFDFNDLPTDPNVAPVVAGGATDRYLGFWLGLRVRLGATNP